MLVVMSSDSQSTTVSLDNTKHGSGSGGAVCSVRARYTPEVHHHTTSEYCQPNPVTQRLQNFLKLPTFFLSWVSFLCLCDIAVMF